jgi:hypothetical protein
MSILIRRWSDGAEYRVTTIDAYNKLYRGRGYYIPYGEHATHTLEGVPIEQPEEEAPEPEPAVTRIIRKIHGSHTTQPVSTDADDKDADNQPSRPSGRSSANLRHE